MTPTAFKLPLEPALPTFFAGNLRAPASYEFSPVALDLLCGKVDRADARKHILLADDDDDILRLMSAFLEADGYEVLPCGNGLRALDVFTARGDIDLLLTDLDMPLMCGDELCVRATAIRPALPVVIVSGSVISEELVGRIRANGWDFMAKPCRVPELLAVIAHRLSGEPAVAA